MKRISWLSFTVQVLLLLPVMAKPQYYFNQEGSYAGTLEVEIGAGLGIMNSLTDLGGRPGMGRGFVKDLRWDCSRPMASIYLQAMYKEAIGLRLGISTGMVNSQDSLLQSTDPDPVGRFARNLGFRSRIIELQLGFEIHPLFFRSYDTDASPYWSPYLFLGIGVYHFNPQARLDGQWHRLAPLSLEGQGFAEYPGKLRYALTQINIPVGVGIRYELSSSMFIRFEIQHRILFTDYLDDVSTEYINPLLFDKYLTPEHAAVARRLVDRMGERQSGRRATVGMERGDPLDNDAFMTMELKWGIRIRTGRRR